jgi:hypothetical protein
MVFTKINGFTGGGGEFQHGNFRRLAVAALDLGVHVHYLPSRFRHTFAAQLAEQQ